MWCEMGSCISRHADPAALGEADARVRAIKAGWRIDALGRLACPRCQAVEFRLLGHSLGRGVGPIHGHGQGSLRIQPQHCRRYRHQLSTAPPARGRAYDGPPNPPWRQSAPPVPGPRRDSGPFLANYPQRAIR